MADSKLNVKNILGIFQSMEYQKLSIDTAGVKAWLDGKVKGTTPSNLLPIDVKNIIDGTKLTTVRIVQNKDDVKAFVYNSKWNSFSNAERTAAMRKFASDIEKNTELLTKIEAVARGIPPEDTKKHGIKPITEYLQYYANYTRVHTTNTQKPFLIYLADDTPLTVLALALGVALAVGQSIVLHCGSKISLSLSLLVEISQKAGIPDGTIQLLPGDCLKILVEALEPSVIFLNGNLYAYKELEQISSSVIAVPKGKTSMIIFNDSDLDSACDAAVSAIWEYQGMLPWAVGTIIVQEDILQTFTDTLKQKMKKLLNGTISDCPCDTAQFYNTPKQTEKLREMVKDAKKQGVEVFPPSDSESFQPTVFIGGKVYGNNVIVEDKNNIPVGNILAFRTPKEAVALANNNRQGLASSVWCQNISLVNEVVRKLDVGTVWVNCHGIIKPGVSFTTRKNDGVGYIGGIEGLYEYIDKENPTGTLEINKTTAFDLVSLNKAQQSWSKLPIEVKIEKLIELISIIEKSEISNSAEWIEAIWNSVQEYTGLNTTSSLENLDLKVFRDPIGVVIINSSQDLPKLIISVLLLGNAVVVHGNAPSKDVELITFLLPPGLLQAKPAFGLLSSLETSKYAILNGETSWGGFKQYWPKIYDFKCLVRRCTVPKNVWTDIGDSF